MRRFWRLFQTLCSILLPSTFFWFFKMENGFEMMFVNASRLLLLMLLEPRLACRFEGNKAGNRITTFRLEI